MMYKCNKDAFKWINLKIFEIQFQRVKNLKYPIDCINVTINFAHYPYNQTYFKIYIQKVKRS